MKKINKLKILNFIILSSCSMTAMASGYHFGAQSVTALSTANSSGAEAEGPATIFHNPAGLTYLPGKQLSGNLFLVLPKVKHSNARAVYFPSQTNDPVKGSTNGDITDSVVVVPQFYGSYQLNSNIYLGLGFYVPFASTTEYEQDSVLRYNINKTRLVTYNINPSIAFKLTEQHSFGMGLIAQYATAELRQFANYGGFFPALNALGRLPDQANPKLIGANAYDGNAELKGNDWGFGYNIGWLWDINDKVRVGANYRSKISHQLKGSANWRMTGAVSQQMSSFIQQPFGMLGPVPTGAGYVTKEDVSVSIITPESLAFQGMIKVNPKINLFSEVTWTRHSRFKNLNVKWTENKIVADPQTGKTTIGKETNILPDWRNTYKIALGGSYQISEPLQLRAGLAYDQAPVKNANRRLTTMPDNDRITLGLGAKYDLNQNHSFNFAYAFMKIKSSSAHVNGWCAADAELGPNAKACVSTRTSGSADYKSHAHMLGLQYNYKF